MSNSVKQFVVGRQNFPPWFIEKVQNGEARVQYESDSKDPKKIVCIGISSWLRNQTAFPGDVIVMLEKGMTVIPKEVAKLYGEKPIKH